MERSVRTIFNCFFISRFNFLLTAIYSRCLTFYSCPLSGAFFLAEQFLRNRENAYMRAEKISRFLTNSSSYGVGSAKWNRFRQDARTDIPVSSRRDVLTGEKIGATRRICSAPRICRFLPGGDLLARLHSRSQFAGTLDADDVSAMGIHYWHSLPMIQCYRYFIKLA